MIETINTMCLHKLNPCICKSLYHTWYILFNLSCRSNDIHSVFNILVRKFMSDVQDLAPSHPNGNNGSGSDADPGGEEDGDVAEDGRRGNTASISPLMDYLIHGRGWLILNAMNTLAGQVSIIFKMT